MSPLGPAYGDGFAGVATPRGTLYVEGDAVTEGSLRLVPDVTGENMEFQRLKDGVWNDTGIQIAASTVHLGRELKLSGAGEWLRTKEATAGEDGLIPHVHFDETGTPFPPVTPVLGPLQTRYVIQPDDSADMVGTSFHWTAFSGGAGLGERQYLKVGSIVATSSVLITMQRGSMGGPIIWQRRFPASKFSPPNTEIEIDLLGLVQMEQFGLIHAMLESDEPFSLKGDGTKWWLAVDVQNIGEDDILTDNLVLSNELSLVFANDGSLCQGVPSV